MNITMIEPRSKGEERLRCYKKFIPDTAQINYECPLCHEKPKITISDPHISSYDPLATLPTIRVNCECFSETVGYDDRKIDSQRVVSELASSLKINIEHRVELAGAPPKGVSLKDWVVGITKYFGGRGQLAPRTSELSEGEKMFMWREIRG